MYQAPEVEHLQRAVDAVKRELIPSKRIEPQEDQEENEETEHESDEHGKQ